DLIHLPTTGDTISPADLEPLIPFCERSDVALCGPGLGSQSHTVITELAPHIRKGVFDADALRSPLPVAKESLYTPHAGEFVRMCGLNPGKTPRERAYAIQKSQLPGTVLLKGSVDVISDGKRFRFNQTGTPAMTTGGTGDVLAGVCAALLVQVPAFEAACIGAYVTGRAGEHLTRSLGNGMTARDLITMVPQVLFRENSEGE
ncbi:MAG TPA: NAD(P)H-hydrate dehydratase, partial [Methanospirillum sp.]|nr:NAD(P)H-hydrate dehydratase [Methanospirillum sp.]